MTIVYLKSRHSKIGKEVDYLTIYDQLLLQNEVLFAVVADRKPDELEEGHLTVSFVYEHDDDMQEEEELNEDSDDEVLGLGILQEYNSTKFSVIAKSEKYS